MAHNFANWYLGWGWFIWLGFIFLMFSSVGNWGYTYRAHQKYQGQPRKEARDILNERYPLFRISLESACYAHAMEGDTSLDAVWLGRHRNEAAHKRCRKAFQSVVRDVAVKLNAEQPNSGDMIVEAYESAIDFGAHPNPRSVLQHLDFAVEDDSKLKRLSLIGLYAPDSFEMQRTLVACLDYGLATAIVLARSLPNASSDVEKGLFRLNETKESLTAKLFESR